MESDFDDILFTLRPTMKSNACSPPLESHILTKLL